MNFTNRFQLIFILFFFSVFRRIENNSKDLTQLPSLCYEDSERLVRTPYGFRCVVSNRSYDKRSTVEAELSSQETDLIDSNPHINSQNNNKENLIKEEDLNSVNPVVETMALSARYRKVVIKNNRGPWKIANMLFKRSHNTDKANVTKIGELFKENTTQKSDGLLVSRNIFSESNINGSEPNSEAKLSMKSVETVVPLIPEQSVEQKFIKNLPKINLNTKTVDKKNLRNFKFNSDIDVIDLMEEDSILQSQSFNDNKTFVVNVMTADKRKIRSPETSDKGPQEESLDQQKSDDKDPAYSPIRIFVFLNRNRNKDNHIKTESSNNRFDIMRRPQSRKGSFELSTDSSLSTLQTSTSTTTTTTTTTTTPKPTTILTPINKLDLNEFEDRVSPEMWNVFEEPEEELEPYVEPTESTISDFVYTTEAPVSRNWNFVCGKRRGFFADVENDCRAYYQCSVRGRQRWECPPNTRFNQFSSTCDWMENVNCLSFKELINEKTNDEQNIDITTTPSPRPWSFSTVSAKTTAQPTYEPDYEDAFEE